MKFVLVLAAALVLATTAAATPTKTVMAGAKLDAMQDHATSNGKGVFTATIHGTKMSWKLVFSKLTGPASAAHIHLGAKGVSGDVLIALCGPCKSGAHGTASVTAAQIKDMLKGKTYVNVHTAKFPNGEIRGQISAH
jgi:CHRD domain